MKLQIFIWKDGNKEEISIENDNIILFNDKTYQLIVTADNNEDLSNVKMLIDNGITKLDFSIVTAREIRTNFKQYFYNCFGYTIIRIGQAIFQVEIQVSQLLKEEADEMLNYIYNKNPYQIASAISDSIIPVKEKKNNYFESSLKRLMKIHSFLALAESQYEKFQAFCQTKLHNKDKVVKYSKGKIDDTSISWMFRNLDKLEIANSSNGKSNCIKLGNNKFGYFNKILSRTVVNDLNTYENQIILGAINSIGHEIEKIRHHFKARFIKNTYIKNSYHSFEVLKNKPKKKVLIELIKVENKFFSVSYRYKLLFKGVRPLSLYPRATQIFTKIFHYKLLYEGICNLKKSHLNLDGFNPFLNIKNIHKLYEIFNYYLLLETLTKILKAESFSHNYKNFDHETYRKISFKKGLKTIVNFYYEPEIRRTRGQLDVTNLYPVLKNVEYLTPDYIIEFTDSVDYKYIIIDAKFSNLLNVKKELLPKLAKTYILGLRKKNNSNSLIDNLILVYPNKVKLADKEKSIEILDEDDITGISIITSKVKEREYLETKISDILNNWLISSRYTAKTVPSDTTTDGVTESSSSLLKIENSIQVQTSRETNS